MASMLIPAATFDQPFLDGVIEPVMFIVFYFAYIMQLLPTLFVSGWVYMIAESVKPLISVLVLFIPQILSYVLSIPDLASNYSLIFYYTFEVILSAMPHISLLAVSAFASLT